MARQADVSVIIGTFGEESWRELAQDRAVPSAKAQTLAPLEIISVHGATLQAARNQGAMAAQGKWLCFLDADDELDPNFLEAMSKASGQLRAPAVQYVRPDGLRTDAMVFDDRDIRVMNPCVIGTLVPAELFNRVGGFGNEPIFEDWALWLKCWRLGADIVHVPDAIYIAHDSEGSRNKQGGNVAKRTYERIRRKWGKR